MALTTSWTSTLTPTVSSSGMPRGRSLYGSLPQQLVTEDSFASRVSRILSIRASLGIDVGTQLDIPDVAHPGMLVMVHRLDGGDPTLENAQVQVTVLNFTGETIEGTVRSSALIARRTVTDAESGDEVGRVDDLESFSVRLAPYAGLFLLISEAEEDVSATTDEDDD